MCHAIHDCDNKKIEHMKSYLKRKSVTYFSIKFLFLILMNMKDESVKRTTNRKFRIKKMKNSIIVR